MSFQNLKLKRLNLEKKVFDWKIPYEWNVNDAYIEDKFGKKLLILKKQSSFNGLFSTYKKNC